MPPRALAAKGDYEKAIASFEKALKIYPNFTEAKDALVDALRKRESNQG